MWINQSFAIELRLKGLFRKSVRRHSGHNPHGILISEVRAKKLMSKKDKLHPNDTKMPR
jgi:hypothetical protein